MKINLTIPGILVIKIREIIFMTGLVFMGSLMTLNNFFNHPSIDLSFIGYVVTLHGIALFPFRKDKSKRNWSSLLALSPMSSLSLIFMSIDNGKNTLSTLLYFSSTYWLSTKN